MAKDDYDVILYRLLVYLYACKKRKIAYNDATFHEAVTRDIQNDQWFYEILEMANEEGLISGAEFQKAWGGDKAPLFDYNELEITPGGIRYLKENGTMAHVGKILTESIDIISKLAGISII